MGKKLRTPLIYLAIVVLMIVLLTQLQNGGTDDKKIEYADFLAMARKTRWRPLNTATAK